MKRSWVDIDLGRFAANLEAIRVALHPSTERVLVVKADAYGHGLEAVTRRAIASGVRWFAVAYVDEALAVRALAPEAEVVILGAAAPEDVGVLAEQRLLPVIVSEEHGRALAGAAQQAGVSLRAHLKIDTGMGRFGVAWAEAEPVYYRLAALPHLALTGLCTHLASYEPRKPSAGPEQVERFAALGERLSRAEGRPLFRHVSSSRALLYRSDWDLEGVRPGIAAYGYGARERGMRLHTEPVLQWRTTVLQVKSVPAGFPVGYYGAYVTPEPTVLATIACGYADGYSRQLSNRGFALVGGRRCAVAGRVSMNWIALDCGSGSEVCVGDEVVLVGAQGGESIWADELARLARTIPYEIVTCIHPSCERRYRRVELP